MATSECCGSLRDPLPSRRGLTLIEIMLTLVILGVLAAILLPQLTSNLPERLQAAAQVVSSDLDYARALAVTNNSKYRITFQPAQNRYTLQHSGADAQLNTLPRSPFRQNDDTPDRQTTDLSELPLPKPGVRLVAIVRTQGGGIAAGDIEFTALGATTSPSETVLWLACGSGSSERFISVHVDPVTGQVSVGPLRAELPAIVNTIAEINESTMSIESPMAIEIGP
jgi:prepilin-type N-terminal cleavage/methylation domain-containing protein